MTHSFPSGQWNRSLFDRIALKVALVVAGASGGGALLAGLSVAMSLGMGLVAGIAAYLASYYWVTKRLDRAHESLREIQDHDFETLEGSVEPNGDEIDRLVWGIYRAGQALDTEYRELKEMESYRREFIGNVSHELKTPIFSVQGFTETLLNGAVDDPDVNRSFLKKILRNVNRLDNLARDLSAISSIETGEMEMAMAPFEMQELVDEVVESLEMRAEEQGVEVRTAIDDQLPLVRGDRERIRQVIVNLTDNAIKYNSEGGYVEIAARGYSDGEVEIAVSDDGIGIPDEHINRLTERFYRVDKSRSRNRGGTGLGLSIVKHILGAHDRELQVESALGEGSTFSFTMPVDEKEPVA